MWLDTERVKQLKSDAKIKEPATGADILTYQFSSRYQWLGWKKQVGNFKAGVECNALYLEWNTRKWALPASGKVIEVIVWFYQVVVHSPY